MGNQTICGGQLQPLSSDTCSDPTKVSQICSLTKQAETWACNACTLINGNCDRICQACETPRGTVLLGQAGPSESSRNQDNSGACLLKKSPRQRRDGKFRASSVNSTVKGQVGIAKFFFA